MTPPTTGRVLAGRYRLEQVIAHGGMATVWLGRDELLGRRVAVKTLDASLARDDALRGRFRQEAIAAAALSHPNIVATYDTGDDDTTAFIVMELVPGESLRQLLDRKRVLDLSEAGSIAHQVALALDHAHRNGIVHRDVKPANVLVPREGPVKVTDFGIAKAAGGGDFTRTGTVVGTARYLSPEQVQGLPTDARTDVYSLGLVLYEMLAGRPAYRGDTELATAVARLTGPPTPLSALRPGIPASLEHFVAQALQPEPAHRLPSAAAFDEHLQAALAGVPRTRASAATGSAPAVTGITASKGAPVATGVTGAATAVSHPPTGSTPTTTKPRAAARPPRRKQRGGALRVIAFLVFLAILGLAAGLLTAHLVNGDSGNGHGSSGAAPRISGASDFDPFGDNGRENPAAVPLAIDGNPSTAWTSETYATRDFGGKPGVGLILDLAADAEVQSVEVQGPAGADVEVYVAASPQSTLDAWGPVRGAATDIPATATVTLRQPTTGKAVLVWFTRTPESGRIEVSELRVG